MIDHHHQVATRNKSSDEAPVAEVQLEVMSIMSGRYRRSFARDTYICSIRSIYSCYILTVLLCYTLNWAIKLALFGRFLTASSPAVSTTPTGALHTNEGN